jgi:uncharacterized protein YvpB
MWKIVKINNGKIGNDEISSVESYLIYDYDWFNIIYSNVYLNANNSKNSLDLSK